MHFNCINYGFKLRPIVLGRYDGNVCVYNSQLTLESSYQYKSDSVRDKHSNIVWEVSYLQSKIYYSRINKSHFSEYKTM